MLLVRIILVSASLVTAAGICSPALSQERSKASATLARDINGFELGMHLREANRRSTIRLVGGSQFETRLDGIAYYFEVTPAGRIYRISSSQPLGRFGADAKFLAALRTRLEAKYGPAELGAVDPFSWELIEPVRHLNGFVLPFRTMWFSVQLTGAPPDEVGLDMTMIDFRLLWADEADQNQSPREQAERAVRF